MYLHEAQWKAFDPHGEEHFPGVEKWQQSCCALCQLTAKNNTPIRSLKLQLKQLKQDSERVWGPGNRRSGERAAFVIISPGENILEQNVLSLGFIKTFEFPRRNGYPEGVLKMYMTKW